MEHVGHEKWLWRRVYSPTGREGLVPVAFVFGDTTTAKVANTVAVLEEAGRRYWAPRRYETPYPKAVIARDHRQAVPVVITTLEQLTEHGAGAAVWRRLGREGEQTLTAALVSPDGHALYRRQRSRRRNRPSPGRHAVAAAARSRADPAVACSAAAAAPHGDATCPAGQGGAVRAVGRSGRGGLLRRRGERGASALLHSAQLLPVDLGVCGGRPRRRRRWSRARRGPRLGRCRNGPRSTVGSNTKLSLGKNVFLQGWHS